MKTALNQLEDWILKFERQNGTPTMCEIKAQLNMFKEFEKEQIINAYKAGEKNIDFPALHGQGTLSDANKYYKENYDMAHTTN